MRALPAAMPAALIAFLGTVPFAAWAQLPEVVGADEALQRLARLEAETSSQQVSMDHIWTVAAACLVFLMQGGFLLLEAGSCRAKNSISVAQKNIADFIIAVSMFYLIGFGLMFGASNGLFGTSFFMLGQGEDWDYTFFVFQAVFCGTAATIVSGAIAERMGFPGYIIVAAIVALVIYPVFGHWAWGNLLIGDNTAWLADLGFIDFAGSTVVHSAGGWVALAAIIIIGPRTGRFDAQGNPQPITGHSIVLATFGAVVLWVGWFGFNGGSTTAGTPDFARIIFNTLLAGTFGGAAGMILGYRRDGLLRPERSINGVLGGLVGITAGCDALAPHAAVLVGLTSGLLVVLSQDFIERRLKLDDVVGAVSVHGVCGAWGTLILAILAAEDRLVAGSRLEQIGVQLLGIGAGFVWMFGAAYILLHLANRVFPLRVSAEAERLGLNVVEHGTTLGTHALQEAMSELTRELDNNRMDLSRRLDETTGDESADLAIAFNRLMGKLQSMVASITQSTAGLVEASMELRNASKHLADGENGAVAETTATPASGGSVAAVFDNLGRIAGDVRQRAGHSTQSINAISGGIDQMTTSILDVAKTTHIAAQTAARAEQAARQGITHSEDLESATSQIRDFLGAIRDLAHGSRKLAVNARIEAERAGEVGLGFAVVATEVKELASRTESASNDAESRLQAIEQSSSDLLRTLQEITQLVGSVSHISNDVDQAVGQQTELADGMRHRMAESSEAAEHVNLAAEEIAGRSSEAAAAMSSDVRKIAHGADRVAEIAAMLEKTIAGLRAAPAGSSR